VTSRGSHGEAGAPAHRPLRTADLLALLHCEVISGGELLDGFEVNGFFAADLMSDVLAFAKPGNVLITGLTSLQAVHTADVAEMRAIVFVDGKRPTDAVRQKAEHRGIPLLATHYDMFEACGRLYEAGHRTERRP
jgi:predicted transcriptional regulator